MSDTKAPKAKKGFKLTKKWIVLIVVIACIGGLLGTYFTVKAVTTNAGVKVFDSYISAAKSQDAAKMAGLFYEKGSDDYNNFVSNTKSGKKEYKDFINSSDENEIKSYLITPEETNNKDDLRDYGLKMLWEQTLAKNIKDFNYTVVSADKYQIVLNINLILNKELDTALFPGKYSARLTDGGAPGKFTVTFKKHASKNKWYIASDFRLMYGPSEVPTYTSPYVTHKDGRLELKRVNLKDDLYSEDGLPVFYTQGDEKTGDKVYDVTRLSSDIVSIGRSAFANLYDKDDTNTWINVIVLPKNLENISPYAFNGCAALKRIEFTDGTSITAESDITIGDGVFYGCESLTDFVLPVKNTIIPNYLLVGCKSITSFTIPASTTAIGYYAFYGCNSIVAFNIPDSVTAIGDGAFEGCTGMTTIAENNVLSNNITRLGANVFKNCIALTNITLPDTLTQLDLGLFDNCEKLSQIDFPDNLKGIGNYVFRKTAFTQISLPGSVERIGNEAFAGSSIINFNFTNDDEKAPTIRTIGNKAFYECKNLSYMELPDTIKGIGDEAFRYCTDMRVVMVNFAKSTIVGENVFSTSYGIPKFYLKDDALAFFRTEWYSMGISLYSQGIIDGNFAIQNETRLDANGNTVTEKVLVQYLGSDANVTLSTDITRIGNGAFSYSKTLRSIANFGALENLNYIGSDVFTGSGMEFRVYGDEARGQLYYVGNWVIKSANMDAALDFTSREKYKLNGTSTTNFLPDTIGIASNAFASSDKIETITFPKQLKYIGESAFSLVNSLLFVEFESGNQLKWIGDNAFYSCGSLDHIILADTLTEIGNKAFDYCTDLRYVRINSTDKLLIGTDVFRVIDTVLKIYVKGFNTEEYYKNNEKWKIFAGNIFDTNIINGDIAVIGDTFIQYLWTDINIKVGDRGNYSANYNYTLPANIKVIGEGAFAKSVISAITIHPALERIEQYAFYTCASLREVDFEATTAKTHSLVYIGKHAFRDCDSLSEEDSKVIFRAEKPNTNFTVGDEPFDTSLYRNIHVPVRNFYLANEYWGANPAMLAATNDPSAIVTLVIVEGKGETHLNTISTNGTIQRAPGEKETLRVLTTDTANGYEFIGWYNAKTGLRTSTSIEITFGEFETSESYEARFVKKKAIATIINSKGGTIGSNLLANIGENITVTATPDIEYEFMGWYVDGVLVSGDLVDGVNKLTLLMPYEGVQIEAEFEQIKAWLNVYHTTGGSFVIVDEAGFKTGEIVKQASQTDILLGLGQSVTITASPDRTHVFAGWVIGGVVHSNDPNSEFYDPEISKTMTFAMYDDHLANIGIRPLFEDAEVAEITVKYNSNTGTVTYQRESDNYVAFTANAKIEFALDSVLFLKAAAKEDYMFAGWRVVGTEYGADEYLSIQSILEITITEDIQYEAIFVAV